MKCPNCSKEIANDNNYCKYCGTGVEIRDNLLFLHNNCYTSMVFLVFLSSTSVAVLGGFSFGCGLILIAYDIFLIIKKKISLAFGLISGGQIAFSLLCLFLLYFPYAFYSLKYLPLVTFIIIYSIYNYRYAKSNKKDKPCYENCNENKFVSRSNMGCHLAVHWTLLLAITLISTANVFFVALSYESENTLYFIKFGWIVPALSSIIFCIAFILSLNKKNPIANTFFIGVILITNCVIWECNRDETKTTDYARAELRISKDGKSIGVLSDGDEYSWSPCSQIDEYLEETIKLVKTWGPDYEVYYSEKKWMKQYDGGTTIIMIGGEVLFLMIYLIYAFALIKKDGISKSEREIDNDIVYCGYCGVKVEKKKGRNLLWMVSVACCAIVFVVGLAFIIAEVSGFSILGNKTIYQESVGEYVDLGLPSGTMWKNVNESVDYNGYDETVALFGDKLPTKEQWEELAKECTWDRTGNEYKVTGKNGNHITLPAAGYRGCNGGVINTGADGGYWSSTPYGSDDAWFLYFYLFRVHLYYNDRCIGRSVRLVQD